MPPVAPGRRLICTLIVGAASMAVIVTQTTWFKEWLRGFIVRQAEDYVNGRLSIGRLDGNLFFGVELEDVDVTMNGETVVDIKDVGLDYNAFSFLSGDVVLDDIRLNQPVFRLEKDAEGWNLAQLIKARTPDPDEPKSRRPIEIGEIGISDGTLYIEDEARVGHVAAVDRAVADRAARCVVRRHQQRGRADGRDRARVAARRRRRRSASTPCPASSAGRENGSRSRTCRSGRRRRRCASTGRSATSKTARRTIDLKASSDKFDVDEIARLVPALRGYALQPAFEVTARGPLDRLSVDLNVRETKLGQVTGDLTVDAAGPRAPGRRHGLDGAPQRRAARCGTPSPHRARATSPARRGIDLALPSAGTAASRHLRGQCGARAGCRL